MFALQKNSVQFYFFVVFCVIFICIKIPYLNIPYYIDEAWVYVPGIKAMVQHGISLFPDAIPAVYSRGHPMLFYCTGAIWVKLFGDSFISIHSFALVVSMSFIFILYYVVKRLFDSTTALVVASITLAQPVFFAQSGITLPEVFLSLWAILALYFFIIRSKYAYWISAALMVMTKESGLAIVAGLMLYQIVDIFSHKITPQSLKLLLKELVITIIPVIPYLIFLLVQHSERGYYFFPNHIHLINFNWRTLQEKLRHCYYDLFIQQGRIAITLSLLVLFAVYYKQVPLRIRLIVIAGLLIGVKIFFRNWALPGWLTMLLMVAGTFSYYYWVHIKYASGDKVKERILAIVFVVFVVFVAFSSVNFLVSRYLFVLIPFVTLYLFYYIRVSFMNRELLSYVWASAMILVLVTYSIFFCKMTGDDCPKYFQVINVQQRIVNYFEEHNIHEDSIYCEKGLVRLAFTEKGFGYLSGNAIFSNFSSTPDKNTMYIIYFNMDFDPPFYFDKVDTLPPYRNIKNIDCGIAHAKVFKRIL